MSLSGWVLLGYIALCTVPLSVVDMREHRLPNKLVVPGMALALLSGVGEAIASSLTNWQPLICAGGCFALMLLLALIGGMGMGDVKLAFVLGGASGFFGWECATASMFAAFILGGGAAFAALIWRRVRRQPGTRHIAFGPAMLAGFWLTTTIALTQLWG